MWRVYTREKPARPWLGLIMVLMASAACLGLAEWMTVARNALQAGLAPQSLGLIEFGVPEGFDRGRSEVSEADEDEPSGSAVFRGESGGSKGTLRIKYKKLPSSSSPEDALKHFLQNETTFTDPSSVTQSPGVSVSGQEFLVVTYRRTYGDTVCLAATCRPDGLALAVKYDTKQWTASAETTIRAICRSVRFADD